MKFKIALCGMYLVFIAIAVFQWQDANRNIALQAKVIDAYGSAAAKDSQLAAKVSYQKLASAAQGEARFAGYLMERNRVFVLLSVLLTLPMATYIAADIRAKKVV